ncbi:MAG: prolipoprotein diacylglyceryl transferase [Lentisphaeria bacterium]|nr:prolipoprotein diacylglyceryl transferase [Lentisphaeria bacterium]
MAFSLFGMNIHYYGIMAACGFLASLAILQYKRAYARMSSDQIVDLSLIVIFCGIIGARIAYVIQFSDQFRGNLKGIFRIDQGGLVFYGGFILAALVILLYVRKHKLTISRILDICAPAMAVGHAFGRVGCYIQGCCFGNPCKGFGVIYPPGSEAARRFPDLTSVHENLRAGLGAVPSSQLLLPVQLLESAGNLLIGIGLLFLFKKVRKTGWITGMYFIAYGVLRFVLECFRGDHTDTLAGLTRAQWVGLCIMIPAGIFCFLYFGKYGDDAQSLPPLPEKKDEASVKSR